MTDLIRPSGRAFDQLREITLETSVTRYAEGSCLAKFGNTHVLCTASWEKGVPGWMKGKGAGWVTAEYGMLPRATHTRGRREAAAGKQSGRTQEIQRLIGRSLRSVVDLASITGGFVALALACRYLKSEGVIKMDPILKQAAAISVGVYQNHPVLDVDYPEDSQGEADMNVVMSSDGGFIEVQGTGEERPLTRKELDEMLRLAEMGCNNLFEAQKAALA